MKTLEVLASPDIAESFAALRRVQDQLEAAMVADGGIAGDRAKHCHRSLCLAIASTENALGLAEACALDEIERRESA